MIDKQTIIKELESKGEEELAKQAQSKLPDQVNVLTQSDQLRQLGLDPQDLASKFLPKENR